MRREEEGNLCTVVKVGETFSGKFPNEEGDNADESYTTSDG